MAKGWISGEELQALQKKAYEEAYDRAIRHQMKLYRRWRYIWPSKAINHKILALMYQNDRDRSWK